MWANKLIWKSCLIIASIASSLTSCKTSNNQLNVNRVFNIDTENRKTLIDLKLSDLVDSCWLIPLETTKESMLAEYIRYIYVANDYIVIDNNQGMYLFTKKGKFINKLNVGRGPYELSNSHSFFCNDKEDLIFINNRYTNEDKLLCYDVKSQTFRPPINKCLTNQWGDFIIYQDSLIIASPYVNNTDPNPYAIFVQDLEGNFLYGVNSTRMFTTNKQEALLQRMLFYSGDQNIHVKYIFDDTLFSFKDNKLSPYLSLQFKEARDIIPNMIPEIGETRGYFEDDENSSFLIFRIATYHGLVPYKQGAMIAVYKNVYFLLNKSNGEYGVIKSYTDDFVGNSRSNENEAMTFPASMRNNKLYVVYKAYELIQKESSIRLNKNFPESLYDQYNKIKTKLTETDNPILLICTPKNKFRIPK
jgi:hypothetical protein